MCIYIYIYIYTHIYTHDLYVIIFYDIIYRYSQLNIINNEKI